jgi:hypothetical protein
MFFLSYIVYKNLTADIPSHSVACSLLSESAANKKYNYLSIGVNLSALQHNVFGARGSDAVRDNIKFERQLTDAISV